MRLHGAKNTDELDGSALPNTVSLDGSNFSPRYPIFNIPSPSAPIDSALNNTENANSETNANKGTWL